MHLSRWTRQCKEAAAVLFRLPLRLRLALSIIVAFGLVLPASLIVAHLWREHTVVFLEAQRELRSLTSAVAEETRRLFADADSLLTDIATMAGAAPVPAAHGGAFPGLHWDERKPRNHIDAVFMLNATGELVRYAGRSPAPEAGAALARHAAAMERRLAVELLEATGSEPTLILWRRLDDAAGRPVGAAAVRFSPGAMEGIYRDLRLPAGATVELLRTSGTLLARLPRDGSHEDGSSANRAVSWDFAGGNPLKSILAGDRSGGARPMAGRLEIPELSLAVAVALDPGERLRGWRESVKIGAIVVLFLVFAVAVTALILRSYERERKRAQGRALHGQRLELLGQMTAGVAHDFRNLLTVILGNLDLIERREAAGSKAHARVSSAIRATERATKLVTQMLAFTRPRESETQTGDINALLRDLAYIVKNAAGPNIGVTLDLAQDLLDCKVEPVQFDSAVLNVVMNARDAMDARGRIAIATLNCEPARAGGARRVEVTITDDGPGMAPGVLERIAEPFFTTKAEGGTGLGLSQIHSYMQRIGGDMRVESAVGKGTSVHLYFACG